MGETWNMNKKEIDRYEIIQRVINKQITQIKAAELLKISPRRLRKLQRHVETYLSRPRRECFGELIQFDASIHCWFGPDLPIAALIVGVDDATSILTSLVFAEGETTVAYFSALKQHIEKYGIPRSLYTDKDSVFKIAKGIGVTQFHRALT